MDIYCPITHMIMFEPVVAQDNIVYEKDEILKWLKKSDTSPVTRQK